MSEDGTGTITQWNEWIERNLHGRVSVPRIQKMMRESGVDPDAAYAVIAEVARGKERNLRRTATRRLVAGLVLLLIAIALTSSLLTLGRLPRGGMLYCVGGSALAGVGLIGQGLWWRRRAAAFANPRNGSGVPRRAAAPISREVPRLEGESLRTRLQHVDSLDLAEVHDVLHAFFRCPSCGKRSQTIAILAGNFDTLNDPTRLCTALTVEPGRFIPDLGSEKCDCPSATPVALTHVIFCRTNPRSRNDFHLIVQYEADGTAFPLRVAFLEKDGAYSLLSEDDSKRVLGLSAEERPG